MGRPLGPSGGRAPGGGGTGLPDGLSGGRAVRVEGSGAGGAAVSGALAAGATGAEGAGWLWVLGALGCADAGRLLMRRGERAGASAVGAGAEAAAGAATFLAGAFLAVAAPAVALDAATFFAAEAGAAAAFLTAFLAGAGSSGWTGRRRPSASALRRTRSAWASSMEEEWLLTPMPRDNASSRPSLFVSPSSLASS
jgi:hypothetical protein